MDKKVLRWVTVLSGVLCIAFCTVTFELPRIHVASLKAFGEMLESTSEKDDESLINPMDLVVEDENAGAQLKIALPEGVSLDNLRITNEYLTQKIYVKIPTDSENYFQDFSVSGSCDHIHTIDYYREGQNGVIAFSMEQVFEISQSYEDGNLLLDFVDPHEIFDTVIVVDAGHGGRAGGSTKLGIAEKDINLAIVKELKNILDEDESIGVYYTRLSDVNPTLDQRVALANCLHADMFISVHNNASSKGVMDAESGTIVIYNEEDATGYSKRLAEICLDEMCGILGSYRGGIAKNKKDVRIVKNSEVPVILIEVGYMSNRQELELLNSPEYQKMAAQAIYQTIQKGVEEGIGTENE